MVCRPSKSFRAARPHRSTGLHLGTVRWGSLYRDPTKRTDGQGLRYLDVPMRTDGLKKYRFSLVRASVHASAAPRYFVPMPPNERYMADRYVPMV